MDRSKAIVVFRNIKTNIEVDLEIPLEISANDLVSALNSTPLLELDESDIKNCFLRAEKPIALLRGSRTLRDFGVRNGTVIYFAE